ncbi:putative RNA-directed DNA polymerase [Helianthus debilis subsp. tardiflorus]
MATNPSDGTLPIATILHMITLKLSSTNYLYWKNQILPLLSYQKLIGHVDGSIASPPATITTDGKESVNPKHTDWLDADQRAILILNSSLTEEAVAEVLGLTSARQIWLALEAAYSNTSIERMHLLRDSLRQLTKGSTSVTEFARKFKAICDQLAAIGHPVTDIDKTHWFLCGLGSSFENFSTAVRTNRDTLAFRDLVTKAESHEQFLHTLNPPTPPPVAFTANQQRARGSGSGSSQNKPKSGSFSRGSSSQSFSRGPRRPPHCQLCRTDGHYANKCPRLSSFATALTTDENIAQAFHAQCHVTTGDPDWVADSGATTHMANSPGSENKPTSRSRSV